MTTQQLESLLIDQALGELSEEASALLESYLDQFPERRQEATRVRNAVGLTEAAVLSRPLVYASESEANPEVLTFTGLKSLLPSTLYRIAAALILLGIAAGTGFFAGQGSRESSASADMVAESRPAVASPWARYQFEGNGRLAVIPRPQTKKS